MRRKKPERSRRRRNDDSLCFVFRMLKLNASIFFCNVAAPQKPFKAFLNPKFRYLV